MSKKNKQQQAGLSQLVLLPGSPRVILLILAVAVVVGVAFWVARRSPSASLASGVPVAVIPATPKPTNDVPVSVMRGAEAIMVTVELDFGPKIPSVAEALREIERRYEPKEGKERTFSIIEAFGEPVGGKLKLSMRVSTEKEGKAWLIFRRTGQVIWRGEIGPPLEEKAAAAAQPRNLTVFMDLGVGKSVTIDGSNHPSSILEANVKELNAPVSAVWQDGVELEFSFIYSACGCPIKATVKRVGERTERTKELPVMFPDDPAVVTLITQLMRW